MGHSHGDCAGRKHSSLRLRCFFRVHREASDFWSDTLSSSVPVGIPIQCLYGFLRVITHPKIGITRMPMPEALDIADEWLQLPQVRLLIPGNRHWSILRDLITSSRAVGAFVSDIAIAATVMEYGAVLHTSDRDSHASPACDGAIH